MLLSSKLLEHIMPSSRGVRGTTLWSSQRAGSMVIQFLELADGLSILKGQWIAARLKVARNDALFSLTNYLTHMIASTNQGPRKAIRWLAQSQKGKKFCQNHMIVDLICFESVFSAMSCVVSHD
jgi:hypothetical protein